MGGWWGGGGGVNDVRCYLQRKMMFFQDDGFVSMGGARELPQGKENPSILCCLHACVLGSGALKTQKSLICAS